MSRINTTVNPGEAVSDSDLVIEAIVENIDVKHKLFAELDNKASRYMKMIMRNTCTPPSLVWIVKLSGVNKEMTVFDSD